MKFILVLLVFVLCFVVNSAPVMPVIIPSVSSSNSGSGRIDKVEVIAIKDFDNWKLNHKKDKIRSIAPVDNATMMISYDVDYIKDYIKDFFIALGIVLGCLLGIFILFLGWIFIEQ